MKEKYEAIAQEHGLPEFSAVDAVFDLASIEKSKHPLRDTAKQIAGVHEHYATILESILQPEQAIISMHESGAFNEEERMRLMKLLKVLMRTYRRFTRFDIKRDNQQFVQFIKDSWLAWNPIQQELEKTLKKLEDVWEQEERVATPIEYLG